MNTTLTKEQRDALGKEIGSRWDEVLRMKQIKASIFVPRDVGDRGKLRKEYIRVISEIIFIKKSDILHKGSYDYSEVYYVNSGTKVKIWCKIHKEYFQQRPADHLSGVGCPRCGTENTAKKRKKSKEQFIKEANELHNGKYDYSEVNYVNARTKVKIWCKKHKEFFWQIPAAHLSGVGCPKCAGRGLSNEEWIQRFREVHGDKYNYDKFVYKANNIKSIVTCPDHRDFLITPNAHLDQKVGCPLCGQENGAKLKTKSKEQFIKEANELHKGKYDYSEVNYVNTRTKVKIWCKIHNEFFWQKPNNHLKGQGCPKCKQSKGEIQIENYLKQKKIKYETQKRFDGCKHKQSLPFDFYLPDYDIVIEFQGEQHYKSIDHFGGEEGLKQRKRNDQIKRKFCSKEENPNLLEIKYTEINNINNINEILKRELKTKWEIGLKVTINQ